MKWQNLLQQSPILVGTWQGRNAEIAERNFMARAAFAMIARSFIRTECMQNLLHQSPILVGTWHGRNANCVPTAWTAPGATLASPTVIATTIDDV